MKRVHFASGFLTLLAFDTLGQIAFKLTADHVAPVAFGLDFVARLMREPWALAIVFAYGTAFVTYMTLIRDAPVGPLFAASHLEIVTVALLSVALFGEHLSLAQVIGCIAVVSGVILLAAAEKDPAPP
jgi:drug/metabolite transporter (DMT)-like permease